MKNLLYSAALSALFLFSGCDKKKDDASPSPVVVDNKVEIEAVRTGNDKSAASVVLSDTPIKTNPTVVISRDEISSSKSLVITDPRQKGKTIYVVLQYDAAPTTAGFVKPTGSENIRAVIRARGMQDRVLTVSAADFNLPAKQYTTGSIVHVYSELPVQF